MLGKLIIISGFSGAGKGTIVREILKKSNDINLSISATTRNIRENEVEGVNYFFVDHDKFEEMIKNDELLEYAKYVNNYYGTPKKYVLDKLNEGKNVLLEIEMQGALMVKDKYKDAVLIFVIPPNAKTLYGRLKKRGTETEFSIEKRFEQALKEAEVIKKYDYVIVNDNLDNAVSDFFDIVNDKFKKNADVDVIIKNIVNDIKEKNYV